MKDIKNRIWLYHKMKIIIMTIGCSIKIIKILTTQERSNS